MSQQRDDQNGRALAVVQTQVLNLLAEMVLLRGDLRTLADNMAKWQQRTEETAQTREIRIDRLEHRVAQLFKVQAWIVSALTAITIGLIVAALKSTLGF